MSKMRVSTDGLNLRSTPEITEGNIILSLPLAQEVEVLDTPNGQRFREVRTVVNGQTQRGFASGRFLREPLSDAKEEFIQSAITEWIGFNRGAGREDVTPFFRRIGDYWQAIDLNFDGRDRGVPWSAAFISFIARQADYTNFRFSDSHDKYILDARAKRLSANSNAPFWLFRLNEHKPQLGDMVCQWRINRRTFDDLPSDFSSHCDIIVEINDQSVKAIGGNVNNSVSQKTFLLNNNGFLRSQNRVFAVMRNNN